jgi:hypothetical protein
MGELLHVSSSQSGEVGSLLLKSYSKEEGVALTALYFAKTSPQRLTPNTSINYFYINGPGVASAWPLGKSIKLDVCGDDSSWIVPNVQIAAEKWNTSLPAATQIKVKWAPTFAPFSDLKQNCVLVVDDLIIEPDPRGGVFGVTASISDLNKLEILSGNILLFHKEAAKEGLPGMQDARFSSDLAITVLHEMGHFLGLDHQFEKDVQSIMSYDFSQAPSLKPYDREAIAEMYRAKAKRSEFKF